MKNVSNNSLKTLGNEEGFVLVVGMMILVVLSIIGVAATTNTSIELQIAANDKNYRLAFYAAESARSYVEADEDLYGSKNIVVAEAGDDGIFFPNRDDSSVTQTLGGHQSYHGEVKYKGAVSPPRGSGFAVGSFSAHKYEATCTGEGPGSAESIIQGGFYRIGFAN